MGKKSILIEIFSYSGYLSLFFRYIIYLPIYLLLKQSICISVQCVRRYTMVPQMFTLKPLTTNIPALHIFLASTVFLIFWICMDISYSKNTY
jgi:hypothetical protein